MSKLFNIPNKYRTIAIWSLRLLIGATFILSGLSKAIDLWGFIYKIEQYLHVWNIDVTESIIVLTAAAISSVEFIAGLHLATGSYKRVSPILLLLFMTVMLPLSLYIAIANPVDDCGCFGDLWIISNSATCIKNFLLTAGLIFLYRNNQKISGLYRPSLQWLQSVTIIAYIITISIVGYRVQPLLDFRNYKEGTPLVQTEYSENNHVFSYVYEKNGIRKKYDETNLPDSSWTFIDREDISDNTHHAVSSIIIYDDNDEDVTETAIATTGEQLILLIPDIKHADIANTYLINELNSYITSQGGSMIGIIATETEYIDLWRDISMANYPIYIAEDTSLKEIARGSISIIYLYNGIIQWKRTISSINIDKLHLDTGNALSSLHPNGKEHFRALTLSLLLLLLILLLVDKSQTTVKKFLCR